MCLILSTAQVQYVKYGFYDQISLFQKDASVTFAEEWAIHQTQELHRMHCMGRAPTLYYSSAGKLLHVVLIKDLKSAFHIII